jgi:nucleoside-diphosphate-sugar epimerase
MNLVKQKGKMSKKILVTGAFGLVGSELVPALQEKFGADNVISVARQTIDPSFSGIVEKGDVTDKGFLREVVEKHQITEMYHLAGLLSAGGEKNPELAWDVNVNGLRHVLELAREYNLRVFWPSSIAAFGPTTPKHDVPQHTSLEPTSMYGITKVSGELLCQYYHHRYGVDVRSLRYPGLNGWKAAPGDGTTEYAIHIFYAALRENKYTCFLKPDATLPMMYLDDAVRGTIDLMEAPAENITVRTSYNFSAVSFNPAQLAQELKRLSPGFEINYEPDFRQAIAESWPQTIDDSIARKDWGWKHTFGLAEMADELYARIGEKIASE